MEQEIKTMEYNQVLEKPKKFTGAKVCGILFLIMGIIVFRIVALPVILSLLNAGYAAKQMDSLMLLSCIPPILLIIGSIGLIFYKKWALYFTTLAILSLFFIPPIRTVIMMYKQNGESIGKVISEYLKNTQLFSAWIIPFLLPFGMLVYLWFGYKKLK